MVSNKVRAIIREIKSRKKKSSIEQIYDFLGDQRERRKTLLDFYRRSYYKAVRPLVTRDLAELFKLVEDLRQVNSRSFTSGFESKDDVKEALKAQIILIRQIKDKVETWQK